MWRSPFENWVIISKGIESKKDFVGGTDKMCLEKCK